LRELIRFITTSGAGAARGGPPPTATGAAWARQPLPATTSARGRVRLRRGRGCLCRPPRAARAPQLPPTAPPSVAPLSAAQPQAGPISLPAAAAAASNWWILAQICLLQRSRQLPARKSTNKYVVISRALFELIPIWVEQKSPLVTSLVDSAKLSLFMISHCFLMLMLLSYYDLFDELQ